MSHSVSVIIPVHAVITFLEEAICSVISQDFPEVDIIVVNDGSDVVVSAEIIAICSRHTAVTLIEQSHAGPAAARSTGLKQAQGDFILFLDADDILLAHALSHLVSCLRDTPSAIAMYGPKIRIDQQGAVIDDIPMPAAHQAVSGNILPTLLQGEPLLSNGAVLMRKANIERVAFPQKLRQGEDWVTWCRLALLGDIHYAGEVPVLGIRTHADNISHGAFLKPRLLFNMLNMVFGDSDFHAVMSKADMETYRRKHLLILHRHFHYYYRMHGQTICAAVHRLGIARYERYFPKQKKIRVLHVVKWFYAGGAERLLSSLLQHSDHDRFEHFVLSLSDQNERLAEIKETLNIPYRSIEIARGKYNIRNHLRCFMHVMRVKPDILKTWLPPSNIAGGIIGKLLRIPVIWGLHDSQPVRLQNMSQFRWSTYLPARIVCCSEKVYDVCKEVGYDTTRLTVIHNGTDTNVFRPQPEGRKRVRIELGISDDTLLIGMAAEYAMLKRHQEFLASARLFLASHPKTQFLLCGKNIDAGNLILQTHIRAYGLEGHVHLLGVRDDMADIYSALDIHTLNSSNESFGLAVTEAMACETLCVSTNVGIMNGLLNGVGLVYPVSDSPEPLVSAWEDMTQLTEIEKLKLIKTGRARIEQCFSISDTANNYEKLYNNIFSASQCMRPGGVIRKGEKNIMSRAGFTLVELSIVLVIIGLVIGGILVGKDMIEVAEMRSTASDAEAFAAAVNTFKTKFGGLPGDMANITDFIPAATNGNNNGRIDYAFGAPGEEYTAWQQLSAAALIKGYSSGSATSVPRGKMRDSYYRMSYQSSVYGKNGHFISVNSINPTFNVANRAIISPRNAMGMDLKLDDGRADNGRIMGFNEEAVPGCATNDITSATASYVNGTSTSITCKLFFRASF